jgi:hypothetical protein
LWFGKMLMSIVFYITKKFQPKIPSFSALLPKKILNYINCKNWFSQQSEGIHGVLGDENNFKINYKLLPFDRYPYGPCAPPLTIFKKLF